MNSLMMTLQLKSWFKILIYHIKNHTHFYLFLGSLISILILYIKLISFNVVFDFYSNFTTFGVVQFIFLLNTIFILLFLPFYPLFFMILKNYKFKTREKISLTAVSNISFFTIIGYIGNSLNLSLDGNYFFFSLLILYFLLIIIFSLLKIKKKEKIWHQFWEIPKKKIIDINYSTIKFYIRKRFNLNGFLLIFFIGLTIALLYTKIEILGGTDPWYHIGIMRMITVSNSLPFNEYFGSMGFEIIGVVFIYFSGIDFMIIPNIFILFTVPLTLLIIYNIMKRIFSKQSLIIFAIFILLISSLGFQNVIFQFWPTMVVFIQGFSIFFLLYVRIKQFTKEKEPTWRLVRKNLGFNYSLIFFLFITMYLFHSLMALIFLISYSWMYLIYFTKNRIRGFDFILMIILFLTVLIFIFLNISIGHFIIFGSIFNLEWYYLYIGAIAVVALGGFLVLILRRSIDFRKDNFNFIIMGQKFSYYRTIEKFFIPIICVLTLILSIIFFILNSLFLNFNIMTIFTSFNTVLIVIIAFWGLGVFQSKSKGKPLMLWFISFSLLILIGLIFDFLSGDLSFFSRIFYISSPIIGIGFASYFYKLIKIGKIKSLQIKLFLIFLVSFSSITYNIEFFWSLDFYSVNNYELNAVKWYVNNTEDKGVLIIEFGWNPAFAYYDYPFNEGNNSKGLISTQYYITYNSTLIYPENHINENGTNILQQLKNEYQTDVYILLSNWFLSIDDLNAFGRLSEEQINQYYSLPYLNRIYSVKRENGGEVPYYWVI